MKLVKFFTGKMSEVEDEINQFLGSSNTGGNRAVKPESIQFSVYQGSNGVPYVTVLLLYTHIL